MEPSLRRNQVACFIAGAGHSGSTLLGLALGSHPAIFYGGEARKSIFFGDERKPLRKRMCKTCGPECPIWNHLDRSHGEDLYEALSTRTGRPVVVDSTKSIEWLKEQPALLHSRGVKLVLIFLGRDGRAVVNSGVRKYPETSATEHAEKWVEQMKATEELAASFPGAVVRVRYEELVTRPEATLTRLVTALGLPFDPAMLDPFSSEQHPLGGNAGTQSLLGKTRTGVDGPLAISGDKRAYYEQHPKSFVLDLRWKRELPPAQLAEFDAVAAELNRAYAWDEPAP